MPKLTPARLIDTLRATEYREIFIKIPSQGFTFTAKVFKKDLIEKLSTLTQDVNVGLNIEETDDVLYIKPSRAVMAQIEFKKVPSMTGEKFAETIRTTKGTVSVKFPTAYEDLHLKIAKSTLADNVAAMARDQRTNMRVYGKAKGAMVVRPY